MAVTITVALAAALAGCFPVAKTTTGNATGQHPRHSSTRATASPRVTPTPRPTTPSVPDPAESRPATPDPAAPPAPSPTLTPLPAGTVVAQGDVASPKGSIHFHYRMVADGDNTYSAQYSGFTSTVPVPIGVTLLEVSPGVGDGLTYRGVADHRLGGPTSAAAAASSAPLGSVGRPSYLGTIVTYSAVASGAGVPLELGPNKVLAVNRVAWSIPVRQTNVRPVDGGARAYAAGSVTGRTPSGAPRGYVVAPGDVTEVVAGRFGISIADLIWLNANLQVFGDQQYLYEGTTLNLDPDAL